MEDIPSDLAADDVPLVYAAVAAPVSAVAVTVLESGTAALVVEVLKELDKDYMALRSRLVSLIEQQVQPTPATASSVPLAAAKVGIKHSDSPDTDLVTATADEAADVNAGNEESKGESESPSLAEGDVSRKTTTRFKYWPSRQLVSTD